MSRYPTLDTSQLHDLRPMTLDKHLSRKHHELGILKDYERASLPPTPNGKQYRPHPSGTTSGMASTPQAPHRLFNVLGMVYAMVSISIVGLLVWAHCTVMYSEPKQVAVHPPMFRTCIRHYPTRGSGECTCIIIMSMRRCIKSGTPF